jgi:hypothetical protein
VIWLGWRQQRVETLIAALLLALVVALLLPTGLHIASVYEGDGIAACLADSSGDCREKLEAFAGRWDTLLGFVGLLNLVPALLGALLAAPFVLEFERGTFRLAWTQSVTRDRWLTVRLALVVVAVLALSALFMLLMTWWRDPLDDVSGRFSEGFELEGVMPSAYALFAAALVVALGVVLRRTAAAVGLALVAFLAVRIVIGNWARPNYQSPVEETRRGDFGLDLHGAWVFNEGGELRLANGQPPDPGVVESCVSDAATKPFDEACLARHDIAVFSHATYHPDSRFWLFQAIEAGLFVAFTLVLLAFAIWWIRKRIS